MFDYTVNIQNKTFRASFMRAEAPSDKGVPVLLLVLVFSNEMNVKIMVWILLSYTLNTMYNL